MEAPQLSEEELNQIYNWVDEIPLSRPKKNIARDFADGVLVAEIVNHYVPKLVELHNYSAAHSVSAKTYNWNTLNQKVFKKMGFQLNQTDIEAVINCVPDAIERVLKVVQVKTERFLEKPNRGSPGQSKVGSGYGNNQMMGMDDRNYQNRPQMGYEYQQENPQVLAAKDQTIQELKDTIEILELKIKKLEQLVKLKDSKINTLQNKLSSAGIM